jgi:hypothetical protein
MVDELIVECLNRANGCEFTCQRHLLAAHLKDGCLFVEEQCPDPACSQKALRRDILRNNNDIPRCPHCLIVCDGCGAEMKVAELGVSLKPTTTERMHFVRSLMAGHVSRTTRSAQSRSFAVHHATTNTYAPNLPPTPTYAPPRSSPARTPHTAAAGQAPAARSKTHTPLTVHTLHYKAFSASPTLAQRLSKQRTYDYACDWTPLRACYP